MLIDVRTAEEFKAGHIPGATNVPTHLFGAMISQVALDKEQEIILYCSTGNRSKMAGQLMISLGYTHVNNLGGISKWPYEIEK